MYKSILISLLIILLAPHFGWTQVESDKSLEFTNENEEENYIDSLGSPTEGQDGIHYRDALINKVSFTEALGENQLEMELSVAPESIQPGIQLLFQSENNNTGPVTISINGLPPLPLVKGVNTPLEPGDIVAGEVILMIFDGTNFQAINARFPECPLGFISFNDKFCIEVEQHASTTFFNAIEECSSSKARLCSWDEWGFACESNTGELQDMPTTWEWINSSGDHNSEAKTIGNGSCNNSSSHQPENTIQNFRCCYSK